MTTGPLCFGTFPWADDCTQMVLCGLGATFYRNTTFSTVFLVVHPSGFNLFRFRILSTFCMTCTSCGNCVMRILYCSILSLTSRWYLCACLYYVDDLWCGYVLLHNTSCAVHRANRKVAGPSHSNCSLGTRIVSIEAQYWHSIEDADRKY